LTGAGRSLVRAVAPCLARVPGLRGQWAAREIDALHLRVMAEESKKHGSAAELLADWRSAGRDAVAAHAAEKVAELALIAAAHAEEAANEVEVAAAAALEAVERAQSAANRAKAAALQAGEAAHLALTTAEGDRARATQDVQEAEEAEADAHERYRGASAKGFPRS
jgi:hypothetical protein